METLIIKKTEECKIVFACPGLHPEDVKVTFDPKTGQLDINGEPDKKALKEIADEWDLAISNTVEVESKYWSKKLELDVDNGIGIITIGLAKGIVTAP